MKINITADSPSVSFKSILASWRGQSLAGKVLSVLLVVAILGAIGTLAYIVATTDTGEKLTQFYILGPDGEATDYPEELSIDQDGQVIVGIINEEHETMSYRLETWVDGIRKSEKGPLVLAHEQEWEGLISFTPDRAGDNQKVEFLLYKNDESDPYLGLHLWINVRE